MNCPHSGDDLYIVGGVLCILFSPPKNLQIIMNEILLSKIKQTRYLKCSINELTTEKEYNFEAWRPYLGDQYYICFIPAIPVRSIINDILLCRWSGRSGRSILPGYSSHPTHHWLASLLPHLVEMAVGRLREDAGGAGAGVQHKS